MIVVTYLFNVANLEDSPIYIAIEAVAQLLGHVAQVEIVIWDFAHIYMFTEIGIGSIGGTIFNGLSICQIAIGTLSC